MQQDWLEEHLVLGAQSGVCEGLRGGYRPGENLSSTLFTPRELTQWHLGHRGAHPSPPSSWAQAVTKGSSSLSTGSSQCSPVRASGSAAGRDFTGSAVAPPTFQL